MKTKELIRQLVREIFQVTDEHLTEKTEKLEELFELLSYKEVDENTEFPTESTSSNHLYEYSITAEITDGHDTSNLEIICLSSNYHEDFDSRESETPTITFTDFINMITQNQFYTLDGTIYNAISVYDGEFSIGGWTSFDSEHVNFISLFGRQIF